MVLKAKLVSFVVGAAIAFSVPAAASVVTIDFRGDGGVQSGDSLIFTQGGVIVTATAGALAKGGEYNIASQIIQLANGLGNYSNYSYDSPNPVCVQFPALCDSGAVDPVVTTNVTDTDNSVNSSGTAERGLWEVLSLDFNGLDVTLLGVAFGGHGGLGDHSLITAGLLDGEIYSGSNSTLVASDFTDHSAGLFDFIAADGPFSSVFGNNWTLASVTIQINDSDLDPVPAPAGVALLGLGFVVLGLARRRKAA